MQGLNMPHASTPQLTRAQWGIACDRLSSDSVLKLLGSSIGCRIRLLTRRWGFAGKYVLRQEPVKGQGFVSALAAERHPPSRSALCRFFMKRADYERERDMLERLSAAELVPGWRTSLC